MRNFRTTIPSIILIAICYAMVIALQPEPKTVTIEESETFALRSGVFRGYLLGGEGLAADWYWMKALQHVGQRLEASQNDYINLEDLRDLNINLLYPYLDAATDLDPHFLAAYSYGAVVLPAIDRGQAAAIAEKGIAHNPDNWRLYQHLGYIHWRAGDYEKAAEAYEKGAQIEGAPPFMKVMAAVMTSDAGSRTTARNIYEQMAADKADDAVAGVATQKLAELDKLDAIDGLNDALAEFREQNNRCVSNLSELTRMLLSRPIADNPQFRVDAAGRFADAEGKPYSLDREKCVAMRNAE